MASRFVLVIGFCLVICTASLGDDWPMWRQGPTRGSVTAEQLAGALHLQWWKAFGAPAPAWPATQEKLQFDAGYEPVGGGGRIFVPSMIHDSITAYSTDDGKTLWQFYANGPVRFAPACAGESVYFVSDDGHLYCVDQTSGKLRWKFRGGPSDRKVLGNGRLISAWAARGAPVIEDDVVYFAAGVWPFMGIFIHAIDAKTGQAIWTNSGSGSNYIVQPHGSPAFAGVSPQGYLALTKDTLIVPGGRGVPAGYAKRTGEFLFCHVGGFSKRAGGYDVTSGDDWACNRGAFFCAYSGTESARQDVVAASERFILTQSGSTLSALAGKTASKVTESRDRRGKTIQRRQFTFDKQWDAKLPSGVAKIVLVAGDHAYGTDGADRVFAIKLPSKEGQSAEITWTGRVVGDVWNMIAADGRLLVATREGGLFCFGSQKRDVALPQTKVFAAASEQSPSGQTKPTFPSTAGEILKLTERRDGYCVVLGGGDAALITELADHSQLHIVVLESDPAMADALRRNLQAADLLGRRVAVMQGDIATVKLPPYLCHLIVASETILSNAATLSKCFQVLRPYGGSAVFPISKDQEAEFTASARAAKLANATWARHGEYMLLTREGALPDSSPWTHQGASVANTMMSKDLRVKTPLGLLWFGGPSHEGVLPRHGHGPTPQVAGGRLFIEGRNFIRAVDVYTGRLLWQRDLPGVGLYYDNTGHHPGANAIGSNYVSTNDGVYVAFGRECLWLHPATGETIRKFTLPKIKDEAESPFFGYIGVYEHLLIAGSSPMVPWTKSHGVETGELQSRFAEGSKHLVAIDRETGKVLWQHTADHNFRHNAICAGGGKVFCIDRITDARLALLKRRGVTLSGKPTLYALDARSGKVAWQTSEDLFGTWLTYSDDHDILVQATASFRDRARDEPDSGIAAYQAKSGRRLWINDAGYGGPVLLDGGRIITQGTAFDLRTGEHATRIDPITGEASRWTFTRNYGCNTAIGCPNLLTFRSAAAGFFDLKSDGGTGNLGGFRSSCTSNLVPADGVLNAPDYTRTCSCSYQLQCSLALVHMPEMETWTFQPNSWNGARVERIGINFGAPGDRRAEDGTLWIDYPSVGGRSPDVPIQVEGDDVEYFRSHASSIGDDSLAWVAASGVFGARMITAKLAIDDEGPQKYTVRLVHAWSRSPDPPDAKSKPRFNIALQGKTVAKEIDLATQTSSDRPIFTQTFRDVLIGKELEITLSPLGNGATTVLCGVEIIRQE